LNGTNRFRCLSIHRCAALNFDRSFFVYQSVRMVRRFIRALTLSFWMIGYNIHLLVSRTIQLPLCKAYSYISTMQQIICKHWYGAEQTDCELGQVRAWCADAQPAVIQVPPLENEVVTRFEMHSLPLSTSWQSILARFAPAPTL